MSGSDFAVVARAREGDAAAFEYLVLRHQHGLVRLIERYTHDRGEAEDVAQEAFLKAHRKLASFRGESSFFTWLARIAINVAKNAFASRREHPIDHGVLIQELAQVDLHTPERLALADEVRDIVRAAIEQLPAEFREAIVLRELEGMKYEQIAALMNCPTGTVRSRIFRARAAIEERLRESG